MNWQGRIIVLVLIGIPALTGITPLSLLGEPLPGIPWSVFLYAAAVNMAVMLTCGGAFAASALAASVLILLPVVLGGATITWALAWLDPNPIESAAAGGHYVRLALNMLSVIPLALSVVATIPFGQFEQRLLQNARGVTAWEKQILMALRVFNHIAFFVIPDLLEVIREERPFESLRLNRSAAHKKIALRPLIAALVQLSAAGICAALRFIPLWAREIADLPERNVEHNRRSR